MAIPHHRIRGTTPEIERAARHLRHRLTPAEVKLWQALRNRQLGGLRWRCQHPVGRFIVDFYCPAHRLVVEVDGEIHQQQQDYDCARTEHLQEYGYTVIRFSNEAVEHNLEAVLEAIHRQASNS
jgi:very-short-patch-repair endonuclease